MSTPRDFHQPDIRTIRSIMGNYIQNAGALVKQLHFKTDHGPTIGGYREDIWREMFEQIVPKKFVIEQSVFIIDSEGHVSNEVDLAIFDETYTPYIFRYGRLKFLPIEAAAVVVECKSSSLNQEHLENWAASIAALKTSRDCYARTLNQIVVGKNERGRTQTATRPLRILCCLNEQVVNRTLTPGGPLFDIIIRSPRKNDDLIIDINTDKGNLKEWYLSLNHADTPDEEIGEKGDNVKDVELKDYQVHYKGAEVSLLSLNLQLNQLLMLINNPIPFPHKAYATMFNRFGQEEVN